MKLLSRFAGAAICLALAATATPAVAQEVDWDGYTPVAIDPQDTIWLTRDEDYNRIDQSTTNGRFWVLADHSSDNTVRARRSMLLFSVNCRNQTVRQLENISYSPAGGTVEGVYAIEYGEKFVPPGSMIHAAMDYVCTGRNSLAEALAE